MAMILALSSFLDKPSGIPLNLSPSFNSQLVYRSVKTQTIKQDSPNDFYKLNHLNQRHVSKVTDCKPK